MAGSEDADVIGECMGVLEGGEEVVAGWVLTAINKYDLEDPRVVLLSSQALYRVKYKFSTHALIHHERTPLDSIVRIQVGPLYHVGMGSLFAASSTPSSTPSSSPSSSSAASSALPSPSPASSSHGIRIYTSGNTHRTFCPRPPSPSAPSPSAIDIANAIMDAQEAAGASRSLLDLFDIPRFTPLGPLSALANRLKS